MTITYEKSHQRSAAYDEEKLVGSCEYEILERSWIITHTVVDPAYGGQGIAKKLVLCVKEASEREGVKLKSSCSYATKILKL